MTLRHGDMATATCQKFPFMGYRYYYNYCNYYYNNNYNYPPLVSVCPWPHVIVSGCPKKFQIPNTNAKFKKMQIPNSKCQICKKYKLQMPNFQKIPMQKFSKNTKNKLQITITNAIPKRLLFYSIYNCLFHFLWLWLRLWLWAVAVGVGVVGVTLASKITFC